MTRWWRRRTPEIDEELQSHLALETADRIAHGESPAEAARLARRSLHSATLTRELVQEVWGWPAIERLWQDARYALRGFAAHPGFAAVAILSLALGIGANTAAFSLADAALLRPLAVPAAETLVTIRSHTAADGFADLSALDIEDIHERTQAFSALAAGRHVRLAFAREEDRVPEARFGMLVSAGFFEALGVRARLGRTFAADEVGRRDAAPVAVLSYALWSSHFGGDPGAVGRTVRLNGLSVTIVGVLPPEFLGLHQFFQPALYVPLGLHDRLSRATGTSDLDRREVRNLMVRGRLHPDVTLAQASAELQLLGRALAASYPETNAGRTFDASTELAARISAAPASLMAVGLLAVLAGLVLLIACANVASLLLARARARSQEMAIRLAIGAGRIRLLRQLLTESLVLSAAGAAAGIALGFAAIRALASLQLPTDTPIGLAARLDGRTLLISVAAAALSALLFGLAPAWRATSLALVDALKGGGQQAAAGRPRMRGRSLLVIAQVALSLVLLVTSAAVLDAFRRMLIVDPGVRADRVLMLEFDPSLIGVDAVRTREFYRLLLDRAGTLTGVRRAALARAIPFRPNFSDLDIVPDGFTLPKDRATIRVPVNAVEGPYFDTMGTPLVAGRDFGAGDTESSPRVAIVNEAAATLFWPGRSAVGRRFRVGEGGRTVEVVGVAKNGRYLTLAEAPTPYLYVPHAQLPQPRMTLLVQAEGDPASLARPLLDLVRTIDPNQPVFNVRDFRTYFEDGALGLPRVFLQMVSVAGAAGLALALAGLYGLVAYTVSRRTREIAIRLAIGATRLDVLRLVLRQALGLSLAGTLLGLALSIPLFAALSSSLAGLGHLSPWTLAIVPIGLVAVTIVASFIPARRAMAIDAMRALRTE